LRKEKCRKKGGRKDKEKRMRLRRGRIITGEAVGKGESERVREGKIY